MNRTSNPQLASMQVGSCAHLHISYITQQMQQGVRGWWACRDCGTTFVPMRVYEAEIERLTAEIERLSALAAFGRDGETSARIDDENRRLRAALEWIKGQQPAPNTVWDRCIKELEGQPHETPGD